MDETTKELIDIFIQGNAIDKNFLQIAKTEYIVNKYGKNDFDKKMLECLSREKMIRVVEERLDKDLKDLINRIK